MASLHGVYMESRSAGFDRVPVLGRGDPRVHKGETASRSPALALILTHHASLRASDSLHIW